MPHPTRAMALYPRTSSSWIRSSRCASVRWTATAGRSAPSSSSSGVTGVRMGGVSDTAFDVSHSPTSVDVRASARPAGHNGSMADDETRNEQEQSAGTSPEPAAPAPAPAPTEAQQTAAAQPAQAQETASAQPAQAQETASAQPAQAQPTAPAAPVQAEPTAPAQPA